MTDPLRPYAAALLAAAVEVPATDPTAAWLTISAATAVSPAAVAAAAGVIREWLECHPATEDEYDVAHRALVEAAEAERRVAEIDAAQAHTRRAARGLGAIPSPDELP